MFVQVDGTKIVNATPHPLNFQASDGGLVVVPPSGYTIPAQAEERIVKWWQNVEFVTTEFVPTPEGLEELEELETKENVLIVGSLVSAQAYPGRVYGMLPVKGFERVPPAEKRMRADKFVTYHPA